MSPTAGGGVSGGAASRQFRTSQAEDLSKSGGWTRGPDGALRPPKQADDAQPSPGKQVAPQDTSSQQAQQAKPPARTKPSTSRGGKSGRGSKPSGQTIIGPVRAPGTPAGVLLAIVTYPAFVAWLKGGNPAVKAWFNAKFLNKTTAPVGGQAKTTASATKKPGAAGPGNGVRT